MLPFGISSCAWYVNISLFPGNDGGEGGTGGGTGNETKFTQADVNKMLAEEKRKHQEKNSSLIKELEQLKETKGLTEKQKKDLESRIEQLTNESLTKEEQAKREAERLKNDFESKYKEVESDRDGWRGRYTNMLVESTIISEANEFKAVSAEQILAILKPQSEVVPVLGQDGKPTGDYTVKIKHFDEESKKVLDYSPKEKLKFMLENPKKYGNLFQSTLNSGTGSSGPGDTLKGDPAKMTPEQYRQWRKAKK